MKIFANNNNTGKFFNCNNNFAVSQKFKKKN